MLAKSIVIIWVLVFVSHLSFILVECWHLLVYCITLSLTPGKPVNACQFECHNIKQHAIVVKRQSKWICCSSTQSQTNVSQMLKYWKGIRKDKISKLFAATHPNWGVWSGESWTFSHCGGRRCSQGFYKLLQHLFVGNLLANRFRNTMCLQKMALVRQWRLLEDSTTSLRWKKSRFTFTFYHFYKFFLSLWISLSLSTIVSNTVHLGGFHFLQFLQTLYIFVDLTFTFYNFTNTLHLGGFNLISIYLMAWRVNMSTFQLT